MDCVPTHFYIHHLANLGVGNLHIEKDNIYMDQESNCEFREVARKHNMKIWVWTVNTNAMFQDMASYGADAVFTDCPHLLQ